MGGEKADSESAFMATYLSISEIAEILNLSKPTVWRLVDDGDLAGIKIRDTWRVARVDFDSWIEQQKAVSQEKIRARKVPSEKRPVGRPRKKGVSTAAK